MSIFPNVNPYIQAANQSRPICIEVVKAQLPVCTIVGVSPAVKESDSLNETSPDAS